MSSSTLSRVLGLSLLLAGSFAPSAFASEKGPGRASLEGTYVNGGGATLTVKSVVADKGFSFDLTIKSDDDCNGVSYSAEAKFTKPTEASNDEGDSFKIDGAKLEFEPAVEMVGMECARVFDAAFTRAKK